MTSHPGATTPSRVDLPELDALAVTYAQRLTGLTEDCPERREQRDRLVRAALPFTARLARRYQNRGEPMEDLEQVARLGLLKAVDRYDPERGAFTGFAAVTITGELRRHFRDRTWGVHVPRRMQELSLEVTRLDAELTAELRRAPTVTELAIRLRRTPDDILAAQETAAVYASLSLNAPRHDDSDDELADEIGGPDNRIDSVDDRLTVSALLCRLPSRERQILAMRFYGNRTQTEIAHELGISQMHVSRLLSRAVTWLRQAMLSDTPQPWQAGSSSFDTHQLLLRPRRLGLCLRIEVAGEVDRDTAGGLRDALLDAVRQRLRTIELDLTGVSFIDAAGIAALLVGFEAARGAGVRLVLFGAQPYVARALQVARIGFLFAPDS